ncbi:MAG: type III-B CRISPR module RAMP protein Cmr6 [bacterium]|nr:type III-B CRISPR module RAMP protein Cmr6 [bacterium]
MAIIIPVPMALQTAVERFDGIHKKLHPGLLLDRYASTWFKPEAKDPKAQNAEREPYQQNYKRNCLNKVIGCKPDQELLENLWLGRARMLRQIDAKRMRAVTDGPLTLHLARATSLENAGICLHPIYGFVYFPGSGIKGMTRAFATLVWKPLQSDQEHAARLIETIFGFGGTESASGRVIFHDAWPVKWPDLQLDILNSHHAEYYSAPDGKVPPPGDWETPRIVNFLAIDAGNAFDFALSMRNGDDDSNMLDLGRKWLVGALTCLGAGGKTNAGYGTFKYHGLVQNEVAQEDSATASEVKDWWNSRPPSKTEERVQWTGTIELVSPAFLAGAVQNRKDCDLCTATLRGQLRWWWRTMHSAWMDENSLRRLESAIWGNRLGAGAVRIKLHRVTQKRPGQFNLIVGKQGARYGMNSGLHFIAYGIADKEHDRYYLDPGATWNITITARQPYLMVKVNDHHKALPLGEAGDALAEALSALSLLAKYGGVGSKARKGFGSLAIPALTQDLAQCRSQAKTIRRKLGESGLAPKFINFRQEPKQSEAPSIDFMIGPNPIKMNGRDSWQALDVIGMRLKTFVGDTEKADRWVIGLPRQTYEGSNRFSYLKGLRLASPVFFATKKTEGNTGYHFNILAFKCGIGPEAGSKIKLDPHMQEDMLKKVIDSVSGAGGRKITASTRGNRPSASSTMSNSNKQHRILESGQSPAIPAQSQPEISPPQKGQVWTMKITWDAGNWVATYEPVLAGWPASCRVDDPKKILSEDAKGPLKAEVYVMEAKKKGIQVRIEKLIP